MSKLPDFEGLAMFAKVAEGAIVRFGGPSHGCLGRDRFAGRHSP